MVLTKQTILGKLTDSFKASRISILDYTLLCLHINIFISILEQAFYYQVQRDQSTHLSEWNSVLKNFQSCFNTYIPYDPKKTKLQHETGYKRLRKVLTGFISGHTLMFMHNIYSMHFSESSSKYTESKQSQTMLTFGWDDASHMKTLKRRLVNLHNAVSAVALEGILKYCMCAFFL